MTDKKQQEKRQRGDDFQDELRRSWRRIPCWRMRISDASGGTRPADEIILLNRINVLGEAKRTAGDVFKLSMVRTNQQKGLYHFDNVLPRNYGLVFISFLSDTVDETYAVRFIDALRFMGANKIQYIPIESFRERTIKCVKLPVHTDENGDRYYDVRGLEECYK